VAFLLKCKQSKKFLLGLLVKSNQLMLYSEIIAACSQIHTKNTNILCAQNVELLNVKPGGTYSNHWALNG
jgi:hypothetical protein